MKTFLTVVILISAVVNATAQQSLLTKQHYLNVYQRGLKYNDVRTAIAGLNGYLSLGEEATYKDTLGLLYFVNKEYFSALIISQETFDADKNNLQALERIATCYSELGDVKSSVEKYETLTKATKKPYHFYQLALGQYQLKRIAECKQSLQAVITDTASKNTAIIFNTANNENQTVPALAAGYNMLGVLEMDVKNLDAAKAMFSKALAVYPNFVGAAQNKQLVEKPTKTKPVSKVRG
jgi:tetratricopeptide (TPR) repeat protein